MSTPTVTRETLNRPTRIRPCLNQLGNQRRTDKSRRLVKKIRMMMSPLSPTDMRLSCSTSRLRRRIRPPSLRSSSRERLRSRGRAHRHFLSLDFRPFMKKTSFSTPTEAIVPIQAIIRRVEMWRGCLGLAYLCPALSIAGASLSRPCSVSTSRSSNRTCATNASGSRTEHHAFAHGKFCGSFDRRMSPSWL